MELKIKLVNNPELLSNFTLSSDDYLNELQCLIESKYGLDQSEYVFISERGVKIKQNSILNNGDIIHISPTVLGGKGGFGSLLRSFGKQITKSTNKEACRDLTGRRIRHVNNEKKLKEFLSKQNELAKKKEEEKQRKLERRRKKRDNLESSHHLFVDPKYDEQKQKIAEDLDQAINQALKDRKLKRKKDSEKTSSSSDESSENKSSNENSSSESSKEITENSEKPCSSNSIKIETVQIPEPNKDKSEKKQKDVVGSDKLKDWYGIGDLDVSSSDDDEDEEPVKKIQKI